MGTLLLKLAGPLQSWGSDSRFVERKTRHEPTKSGVVGLLASALGRRRTEDIEDLCAFLFGVRVDQPGTFERDFQTMHARVWDKDASKWVPKDGKLSYRYYLADAVFVAGLEMPDDKLDVCADALTYPTFPLYLGRRSCPPADKVLLDTFAGVGLMEALSQVPWQAGERYRRQLKRRSATPAALVVYRDVLPGERASYGETLRDVPVSFSPEHREYTWRSVVRDEVPLPKEATANAAMYHDPWAALDEERG